MTQFIIVYINNGIFNRRLFFDFSRNGGIFVESGGNIGILPVGGDHGVFYLGGLGKDGSYADHRVVGPHVPRHGRAPRGGQSLRDDPGDLLRECRAV
ncbi:MAG: hypothetical protein ACPHBM_02720 [Flavobacteriales bacterium]